MLFNNDNKIDQMRKEIKEKEQMLKKIEDEQNKSNENVNLDNLDLDENMPEID